MSLIGAFMLARGVSRRRTVQFYSQFSHRVSQSLGSCADIRSEALVTRMGV